MNSTVKMIFKTACLIVVFYFTPNQMVLAESNDCPAGFSGAARKELTSNLGNLLRDYKIKFNNRDIDVLASMALKLKKALTPEQQQSLNNYGVRNEKQFNAHLNKGANASVIVDIIRMIAIDWAKENKMPNIVALLEGRE